MNKNSLRGVIGRGTLAIAGLASLAGCGWHNEQYATSLDGKPVTVSANFYDNGDVSEYWINGNGIRVHSYEGIDCDENGIADIKTVNYFDSGKTRSIIYRDRGQTVEFHGFDLNSLPNPAVIRKDIEALVREAAERSRNKKKEEAK